ncbi:MAG: biotin--[Lachnospiraceae bacterium]|nr:biotin--[acetyl-CoA-carboxylase] ligase [Lachnospiraceae bacterium]
RRDLCVICREQTGGRGRQGRSFFSPKDTGVYFSLLLHPDAAPQEAARLTTLAATAEALALDDVLARIAEEDARVTGAPAEPPAPALIKWINDVCMRGKKITGILTESQIRIEEFSLEYVIVGIGINLYEPDGGFPAEIADVAGAVFPAGKRRENLRNRVVSEVLIRFMEYYRDFPDCDYLEDYKKKCFVLGREITILGADHRPRGAAGGSLSGSTGPGGMGGPDRAHARALDIDREAHLLVEYPDGTREYLSSGEVSVRPLPQPCIIANTCFGGLLANRLGLRHDSPFVNSGLSHDEYFQFLSAPERYLAGELRFLRYEDGADGHRVPVMALSAEGLPDVVIRFPHDDDEAVVRANWARRLKRLDLSRAVFTYVTPVPEREARFMALTEGKRRVCLVPYASAYADSYTVPQDGSEADWLARAITCPQNEPDLLPYAEMVRS